jgi:hypothetical protein
LRAIEKRARLYRNTVVLAAAVAVVSPIASIAASSFRPLAFWSLLFPLVASFLLLDSRVVFAWRDKISKSCVEGNLRLKDLKIALEQTPRAPSRTVAAMVVSLPALTPPNLGIATGANAGLSAETRRERARLILATAVAFGMSIALVLYALLAGRH